MINFLQSLILANVFGHRKYYSKVLDSHISSHFLRSFFISYRNAKDSKVLVGEKCLLGMKVYLEGDKASLVLGNNVFIGKSSIICKSAIKIGNNVLISWGVTIDDHDSHSLNYIERRADITQAHHDYITYKADFLKNKNWRNVNFEPIVIEDDVWIGFNSIILKGVRIGKGAIVAAGSIVTKNVEPFTIVGGNPAHIIRKIENDLGGSS